MESGFLAKNGCEIYYELHGSGTPVLFIHAGVADSRMWRDQLDLDGHQSIVFDQRGFGRTKWVPGPYSNREDALAVLDHLDIDAAVIVGSSNGGEAAMQLTLVAPDRVAGLVTVGAAPRGWEPEGGWSDHPIWDEAMAASEAGDLDSITRLDAEIWLAGWGRSLNQINGEIVDLFFEMDRVPVSTEKERETWVQTLEPPTNEQLDAIDCPSLAMVGAHDHPDLIVAAGYLAEMLGERKAVVIEGAAHLPSLEQPARFNAVLRGFLTSI